MKTYSPFHLLIYTDICSSGLLTPARAKCLTSTRIFVMRVIVLSKENIPAHSTNSLYVYFIRWRKFFFYGDCTCTCTSIVQQGANFQCCVIHCYCIFLMSMEIVICHLYFVICYFGWIAQLVESIIQSPVSIATTQYTFNGIPWSPTAK